jgi:hypothetical protein
MCVGVVVLWQMLTFVMIFLISTAPSTLSSVQLEEPLGLVCLEARGGRASGANSNLGISPTMKRGRAGSGGGGAVERAHRDDETHQDEHRSRDRGHCGELTGKCYGSA